MYVHVPFCRTRCGYCDFNTYTATELGPGASRDSYAGQAIARDPAGPQGAGDAGQARCRPCSSAAAPRPCCRPAELAGDPAAIDGEFGLAPGAEVTTEANPETVTGPVLAELRAAGFTRISFGMQSAVPHVLAVLDRVHEPGPAGAVRRLGPRGRLRARQPGPDLRHPGRVGR